MHRPTTLMLAAFATAACSDFATAPDRTPTELRVSPDTVVVTEGEETAFQMDVLDQHGEPYAAIPSWAPPFWSSTDSDLVEVREQGEARALRPGQGRARVELAGLQADAVVRVNPTEISLHVPFAYVTQSVQSRIGSVPLIAGRSGLLRVFVQGSGVNFFRPIVRATFFNGGAVVHEADLTLENPGLPDELQEGDLALSYDADVPASVFQPGLRLVLEVDRDGVVPAAPGSTLRVPAAGTLDLPVREVAPFRLTLVPVEQAVFPSLAPRFTDTFGRRMTQLSNDIFPFGEFDLEVREPYTTHARLDSERGWQRLINEIRLLRLDDGSQRYYYGGFHRPLGTSIGGLGYLGHPVAIGMDDRPDVIAHEIGHTLSLPHAPCGGPTNSDPFYPYSEGRTGQFGYDRSAGQLRDPLERFDLMSYCDPIWISDYNYEKVIEYRETSPFDGGADARAGASLTADEQETLVVQGGVLDGELQLEPALDWTSRVVLPSQGGRYTLEGLDAAGRRIFTLSLEPAPLDHGGSAQFLVALPAGMAGTDRLERLRLSGPEGVVERARSSRVFGAAPELRVDDPGRAAAGQTAAAGLGRWDTAGFPLAVVRDRQTGRIRAMSRTGAVAIPDGDTGRFEVLLSDGLSTRAARVVRP